MGENRCHLVFIFGIGKDTGMKSNYATGNRKGIHRGIFNNNQFQSRIFEIAVGGQIVE